MLNKKSVDDINVKGLKVLVRCDFNVPMVDGKITDENRLVAALPTIKKLIADGGRVILCSHMGKPKGEPKPELSLAPVAVRLSELLGQEVKFAADATVVGENAKAAVEAGCESVVLVDRKKKMGGVLLQCFHHGFGWNLNGPEYVEQLLADFPEEVQQKATSLALETGKAIDRNLVLDAVLRWLDVYSRQLEQSGFEPVKKRWQELSCMSGKAIQIVRQGEALLYGTALGIADDGALLVQTEHGVERIIAGDVSLRAADGGYAV